jgi:hypothetical protein
MTINPRDIDVDKANVATIAIALGQNERSSL